MEERINKMIGMIESGDIEGFLNDIDQIGASKAYLIIRDNINKHHIELIKGSTKENYQKFQDIKLRAKQSWDYDHKMATMEDVNRACMNLYTIVLRIMNAQNTSTQDEFNMVKSAINRIEEKIGLEPTSWEEKSNDDGGTDNASDVQRIKENI